MKPYFFILGILLLSFQMRAQDIPDTSFQLTNIPVNGVSLNKGWKFQAGDNPQWAKPEFDDQHWQFINPAVELHHLPQVKEAGIGWFRLKLQVDSSLTGKAFAMVISSIGASEIYLNGELIYRLGTVSRDYHVEQTRSLFAFPIGFKLANQPTQVLAVRYSFNRKNLYLKFSNIPLCIGIVVKDVNQAFNDNTKGEGFLSILRSIQLSFYLPLGILILFLYYSFPKRNEYLYFDIFCLSLFAGILFQIIALIPSMTASQQMIFSLTSISMYIVGFLSLINGTHLLYKLHKNFFFKVIAFFALLVIPFFFISKDWGALFFLFFALVIAVEFLRLNLLAVQGRRPGAWLLIMTASLLILAIIFMIWLLVLGNIYLYFVVFSIVYIVPAIGLSLFTAGDFARTGLALQLRLKEVERLSAKTISQEKEKQQILTAQNETLERQVSQRTLDLKQSLEELKLTQSQLIQSEKMASFGELTAGIAHEIQNPLNFVNNFSEVNKELIEEVKSKKSKLKSEELDDLLNNLADNEDKISHHGKRADAIVKSMLQHSRASGGQKEPTDINKLADEYLRLAYQGFRAKNPKFNAQIKTDFDPSIGKINIIPQDIGRVMLNLFNNAFYAAPLPPEGGYRETTHKHEPTVWVSTRKVGNNVFVSVKDNGPGIPQKILDKIFQPFFTTKPTGQGTGLGLSLSYDIIKAHGGEIRVETKEGEGTEFIIQLPIN